MREILIMLCAGFLAGCLNSATAFTNRSVTYMVVPEQIGEHSAVTGSPTAADSNVNADKVTETDSKINAGQAVNDSSSNDQSKKAAEEKPADTQ